MRADIVLSSVIMALHPGVQQTVNEQTRRWWVRHGKASSMVVLRRGLCTVCPLVWTTGWTLLLCYCALTGKEMVPRVTPVSDHSKQQEYFGFYLKVRFESCGLPPGGGPSKGRQTQTFCISYTQI